MLIPPAALTPSPHALGQIVTRVGSVFKVAMPASVASLLNAFDVLNMSIDAFGLPLWPDYGRTGLPYTSDTPVHTLVTRSTREQTS